MCSRRVKTLPVSESIEITLLESLFGRTITNTMCQVARLQVFPLIREQSLDLMHRYLIHQLRTERILPIQYYPAVANHDML